jgi:hypothetical protein
MLEIGQPTLFNRFVNGKETVVEEYLNIPYIGISFKGKTYAVYIKYDAPHTYDRFTFSIINLNIIEEIIVENENIIEGTLAGITHEQGEWNEKHFPVVKIPDNDEKIETKGKIKLDIKTGIVTLEMVFHRKKYPEINYTIIWKDHELFSKLARNLILKRMDHFAEKINKLDGIWQNGAFKIKIKGSAYVSFYNNSRYGKGEITYDNEKFALTSSHARWIIFWTPFVEIVKGKYLIVNNELTVSDIEGRYSDYNGKWVRLKNKP